MAVTARADAYDFTMIAAGRWAVGVSGGADSVALLLLLLEHCPASSFHVAHLDHETRNGESAEDARFVGELCRRLDVPATLALRSDIESNFPEPDSNPSARFRFARFRLFERVVRQYQLDGVILAHHADDQAETVLQRLLRGGSSVSGLAGISTFSRVGSLLIVRPLLNVRRDELRRVLREHGQSWREDASNTSDTYLRNRLRRFLSTRPQLSKSLLRLSRSCRDAREWMRDRTPPVSGSLKSAELLELPSPLQRELARRWLIANGVPSDRTDPEVIEQLLRMASDAATAPRMHFPGKVLVRRKKGTITSEKTSGANEPSSFAPSAPS